MRPPRILVVDDTFEVRSLVCRVLEDCGYDVRQASDAEEALAICRDLDGHIDLLLTDLRMPVMNGIELAAHLTQQNPSIRVLYVSGQFDGLEMSRRIHHPDV